MTDADRAFWDAVSASPIEIRDHKARFLSAAGRRSFADCTTVELADYHAELRALVREIGKRRIVHD